ncbi:MAG: DsrE/DsrF/DrsH-like family protein, partial [Deltaproteobacteria bacterium]|nr:DsrE/DsrF/DrsH-like family protein [Deltaproteobacteria bacterium]
MDRKVAIICSKGGLDEVYPAFILANAARMSGIDAMVFFTFYGLDVVNES